MIIHEIKDGRDYFYSDNGCKIREIETGNLYVDALCNSPNTYEETDIPIDGGKQEWLNGQW